MNYSAKKDAFPYQVEAFNAIKDLEYAAIFHEQGLGKTKIAIDLCLYWLTKKDIDSVLIVTKKQLVQNWIEEFKTHSFIKPVVLNDNRGNNFYVFNGISKIIIANFETIGIEYDRVSLFLKCRNVAVVIDESTKIKNPDSNITKCFFELSPLFCIRVIMTGTPVANRPYDIWAQIYFLDFGKALGDNFSEFKRTTDLSNDLHLNETRRDAFEHSVGSIFERIRPFSVRETKKSCSIDLPEKRIITRYAYFEAKQQEMYSSIVRNYMVEVNQEGSIVIDNDEECLKRLLRLNQVTSNPRLLDREYTQLSGKEVVLDSIIKEILSRNEKCIVWSSFIDNVEYYASKYKNYNAVKIHGSMSIDERNHSVKVFKSDDQCKLLFATPQAAKEGLTLTVANNAIFYDRSFNLDDYLQAQDRIHRISQTKTCTIYNIIIKGSIDDWIESLLEAKQYAAALAQGDISQNEYITLANYTYAEIMRQVLQEAINNGENT